MTLREKVGQLTQRLYGVPHLPPGGGRKCHLSPGSFRTRWPATAAWGTLYTASTRAGPPGPGRTSTPGLDGPPGGPDPERCPAVCAGALPGWAFPGAVLLRVPPRPPGPGRLPACRCEPGGGLLLRPGAAGGGRRGLRKAAPGHGPWTWPWCPCWDVLRDPPVGPESEECFGEDPLSGLPDGPGGGPGHPGGRGWTWWPSTLCAQGETTGGVNASAAPDRPAGAAGEIHLPPG